MPQAEQIQPLSGNMARAMLVLLAVEIIAYSLGFRALLNNGWPWVSALLMMLGIYLGIRVIVVGNNFLQTWLARSPRAPEHQLGLLGTLRLLWGEFYVTVICYSFLFPFERWLVDQAPAPLQPGAGTPIILVPGFCCNRGYWGAMARHLSRQGFGPVYAASLEPLFGSMEDNARQLSRFVDAVLAHSESNKVVLVGHSMGGVVSRIYVHQLDGAGKVAKIIALGSPHEGTVIAHMVSPAGENLRQMRHQSPWSVAFNKNQQQDCPVPITSVITPHDNIVAPQASSVLHYPNASNIFLPGVGHLEMPLSRRVMQTVAQELEGV